MKLNKVFLLAQLLTLAFSPSFAQDVHYYGPDTTHHYTPSDIMETQNGDLVLVAAVNNKGILPQNYYFDRYLARIRLNGDTLWTRSHPHNGTQANLLEKADGSLMAWGIVGGSLTCNGTFNNNGYADQSIHTYTSTGTITNSIVHDEGCDESLVSVKKRADGGILVTHNDTYWSYQVSSIKELSPTGQRSSISYPSNIVRSALVEKNNMGYWLMQADSLYRLSLAGNLLWKQELPSYVGYVNHLIKVNQDSLLVAGYIAGQPAGYSSLMKYDSAGVEDWNTTVAITPSHLLLHSSGNYIITGMFQQKYRVMVVSPNGDSLWARTIDFNKPIAVHKTIETSDGNLVTLAEETNALNVDLARVMVVMDTIFSTSQYNSVRKLAPSLAASCYPNPTAGQVQIDIQESNNYEYQVTVVSLLGQPVLAQSFSTPSFSLGVEHLPKGLYILTIRSSSGAIFEEKLVVGN